MKQLPWNNRTKTLPANGGTRYQGVDFEWDERNWDIPGHTIASKVCSKTEVESIPWKEFNVWDGMSDDSDAEAWIRTPWGYWVPLAEADNVMEYYTVAEPKEGETSVGRGWRRAKYAAKAWCRTYPAEVQKWLRGRVPTA